jgi:hypothetical protein
MRRFDEVGRFWNDTRSRLPHSAWCWPLAAATAGMLFLAITSSSGVPVEANSNEVAAPGASHDSCQGQTWPYLSDACLRRGDAADTRSAARTTPEKPQVRVLNYEPAMAAAAVGATPWAPKESAPKDIAVSRQPHAPQKRRAKQQASHDLRESRHDLQESRTVTVRSGRRGRNARERVHVVPGDSAYRAFGSAPR